MGTLTFHPWPVRRADVDHPDELRIDLDPQPGTDVRRRGPGGRGGPRAARGARASSATRRPRATAASTSTCGSSPSGSSPTSGTPRSASAASWTAATTASPSTWWKEERGERIFVDFNQNNRDRTIASAYSLRPLPGAPVSTPMTWDELAGVTDPRELQPLHRPRPGRRRRPVGRHRRHGVLARAAAAAVGGAGRRARCNLPAGLPQDAGRAAAGAAEQEGRRRTGTRTATGSSHETPVGGDDLHQPLVQPRDTPG